MLRFTAQEVNSSLTIEVLGSEAITKLNLQYRTNDNLVWQNYTLGTTINLANIGNWVEMKNKGLQTNYQTHNTYHHFVMTGKIAASGNIMYLLDNSGEIDDLSSASAPFYNMFKNQTSLISAPEIPAKKLGSSSCDSMFMATGLVTVPELPATDLGPNAYSAMFKNCVSLKNASIILPSNTNSSSIYSNMFEGCSALTTAPTFTNLSTSFELSRISYFTNMFLGCSSLKVNQNGTGTKIFTSPYKTSGSTTDIKIFVENMFAGTGGTFTGTPTAGNTYNWYN